MKPKVIVTQEWLSGVQQLKSNADNSRQQYDEAMRKIRRIVKRGGEVEPGPIRLIRRKNGTWDIS